MRVPHLRFIAGSLRYEVWVRLSLNRYTYFETRISDPGANDVLVSVQMGEDIDSPCGAATITLFRRNGLLNLSPLVASAYTAGRVPLLYPGSYWKLETSIDVPGTGGPANWFEIMSGRVDKVNIANDETTMSLTCRDNGGFFINDWLWPKTGSPEEGQGALKFGTGTARLDILFQDILNYVYGTFANPGGGFTNAVSLFVPEVPNFFVAEYPQALGPVLQILQDKALNTIGWDCRFRYDSSETSKLTLVPVHRTLGIPNAFIADSEILSIKALEIDDSDLRNLIEGFASDRSIFFSDFNATSALDYGIKPMRIAEDRAGHIDTMPELQTLVGAAASDLNWPSATHDIDLLYWPCVQLQDVYQFYAPQYHDQIQAFSVTGFQHELSVDRFRTTIQSRGNPAGAKPAAAYKRWVGGSPRMVHVSLTEPVGTAEERALWIKVSDLAFP